MKCDIEVGGSWWWEIHLKGCTIDSDKMDHTTKAVAVRAARSWAKRLRLVVECVYEYGESPD